MLQKDRLQTSTQDSEPHDVAVEREFQDSFAELTQNMDLLAKYISQSENATSGLYRAILRIKSALDRKQGIKRSDTAEMPFDSARFFFQVSRQLERLRQRVPHHSPNENALVTQVVGEFQQLKDRLALLLKVDPVAEVTGKPTILHVVAAHYWNIWREEYGQQNVSVATTIDFFHRNSAWSDSDAVTYVLFKLGMIGVAENARSVTPEEVRQALQAYKEMVRSDERIMPTVQRVYADLNELLEAHGLPPVVFDPDSVYFVSRQQFERYVHPEHGASDRAAYDPEFGALLIPVTQPGTSADEGETVPTSEAELYVLVVHETLHKLRRMVTDHVLYTVLEEGLITMITQRLQEKRGFQTEKMQDVHVLGHQIMKALVAELPTEALLLLDEATLTEILEEKYPVLAARQDGEIYQFLLKGLQVFGDRSQLGKYAPYSMELGFALDTFSERWGVDVQPVKESLKRNSPK